MIWSDECYVYLGDDHGRIYITQSTDEEYNEECLVPTFKQSSVHVMIWGCIMKGKKGPLVVLNYPGGKGSRMNSKRYQEQVLDSVLHQFYTRMNRYWPGTLFQQDGAPGHWSKLTQAWFWAASIPLIDHPRSSPNLNPIELVWHELKKNLRALPHPPTTVEQLIDAVQDAWEELWIGC